MIGYQSGCSGWQGREECAGQGGRRGPEQGQRWVQKALRDSSEGHGKDRVNSQSCILDSDLSGALDEGSSGDTGGDRNGKAAGPASSFAWVLELHYLTA